MTEAFPSNEYATAQKKWIGKDHIVTPTVLHALENKTLIQGKKVLDVGCGTGHYSKDILDWGASEVHGCDESRDMIEKCQEEYSEEPRLSFSNQSIVDYSANGFDVAVAFYVLQFVKNKDDLAKALVNIHNSLNEDGVLVGIIPNGITEFNPKQEEGKRFGAAIVVEEGAELQDGQLLPINFYENGEVAGSSEIVFRFRETYEQLLLAAGFKKVEWLSPVISEKGLKLFGEDFFASFLSPPKDIILKAFK